MRAVCCAGDHLCDAANSCDEGKVNYRRLAGIVLLTMAGLLLGGCGMFGCGGAASNGGGWGGCHVGSRF
ncbi:hypothetical protein BDI4_210009 [Burkholderia diffusa]|nr:hypothetical protein BDI4_210009 [Burkholderia diffusa]